MARTTFEPEAAAAALAAATEGVKVDLRTVAQDTAKAALEFSKSRMAEFAKESGLTEDEVMAGLERTPDGKVVPRANSRHEQQMRVRRAQAATGVQRLIRDMADAFLPATMLTLCEIVSNQHEHAASRITAAQAIADRSSLGKAKEMFTPLTEELSGMSTTDAYTAILKAAEEGRISTNEVNMLTRVLEGRTKAIEMDELRADLDRLKAFVDGTPAPAPHTPRVQ